MELVYRTIDGQIFDTENEAIVYEAAIEDNIKMWNKYGEPTKKTSDAWAIVIKGDDSAEIFKKMCLADGDTNAEGIEAGDKGIYFWNDWEQKYQWLDTDNCCAVLAAIQHSQESCPDLSTPLF